MSQTLYQRLTSDKPFFIVGPCVMESMDLLNTVARELVEIKNELGVEIIFKSSFDKANRN
jgi:2-dehydro-3-deoxyphosphooctonate aldolase (KDO 8-P synthase)